MQILLEHLWDTFDDPERQTAVQHVRDAADKV